MPGPVEISEEVNASFRLPPISHRSAEFIHRFENVRSRLCHITNAKHAALLNGSGTLANEAIASCLDGPGLVLINGEFGARIANQARRWALPVDTIEWPWGVPWDFDRIAQKIHSAGQRIEWIWAVHLETSTGMVNDIEALKALAAAHGVRLCLDCISSLGAVPLDLRGVSLASGVSGKALGSIAGVAMVFAEEEPHPPRTVPTYLDVARAMNTEGPCFTFPSPLVMALERALEADRDYQSLGCLVRRRLRDAGLMPLVDESLHAPVVTTFSPPSPDFIDRCYDRGYWIGGESGYLAARGLVQIANMGAIHAGHIDAFFNDVSLQAC